MAVTSELLARIIGQPSDAEATSGDGSLIALTKRLRTTGAGAAELLLVAPAVSTVAAGSVLSYTVPAGKTARLTHVAATRAGGSPTIQLQVVRAGTTYALGAAAAADIDRVLNLPLQAGDEVRVRCTVGAAGSTTDALLGILESR